MHEEKYMFTRKEIDQICPPFFFEGGGEERGNEVKTSEVKGGPTRLAEPDSDKDDDPDTVFSITPPTLLFV